ncbi:MAG: divalent-cation tolerance protein CutA [Acidobacteriota bacterium]|nr:divalent-cation tolerance protein CutA [Acidobacteriota bacterium]
MTDPAIADCVLVLVTLPADADSAEFAEGLVSSGVAACVNVLAPMQSTYRWEGAIETEAERQVVIKTTSAGVPALWQRVRDLHPYDVPEFLVLPIIDGNEAYLKWVRDSVL